jgi:hypothetical protein
LAIAYHSRNSGMPPSAIFEQALGQALEQNLQSMDPAELDKLKAEVQGDVDSSQLGTLVQKATNMVTASTFAHHTAEKENVHLGARYQQAQDPHGQSHDPHGQSHNPHGQSHGLSHRYRPPNNTPTERRTLRSEKPSPRGGIDSALWHHGRVSVDVGGDGDCQFRALAKHIYGDQGRHKDVRKVVHAQLTKHPDRYDSFNEEWDKRLPDRDRRSYAGFLKRIKKQHQWGGNATLKAAADAYGRTIHVVSDHHKYEAGSKLTFVPDSSIVNNEAEREAQTHPNGFFLAYMNGNHYRATETLAGSDSTSAPPDNVHLVGSIQDQIRDDKSSDDDMFKMKDKKANKGGDKWVKLYAHVQTLENDPDDYIQNQGKKLHLLLKHYAGQFDDVDREIEYEILRFPRIEVDLRNETKGLLTLNELRKVLNTLTADDRNKFMRAPWKEGGSPFNGPLEWIEKNIVPSASATQALRDNVLQVRQQLNTKQQNERSQALRNALLKQTPGAKAPLLRSDTKLLLERLEKVGMAQSFYSHVTEHGYEDPLVYIRRKNDNEIDDPVPVRSAVDDLVKRQTAIKFLTEQVSGGTPTLFEQFNNEHRAKIKDYTLNDADVLYGCTECVLHDNITERSTFETNMPVMMGNEEFYIPAMLKRKLDDKDGLSYNDAKYLLLTADAAADQVYKFASAIDQTTASPKTLLAVLDTLLKTDPSLANKLKAAHAEKQLPQDNKDNDDDTPPKKQRTELQQLLHDEGVEDYEFGPFAAKILEEALQHDDEKGIDPAKVSAFVQATQTKAASKYSHTHDFFPLVDEFKQDSTAEWVKKLAVLDHMHSTGEDGQGYTGMKSTYSVFASAATRKKIWSMIQGQGYSLSKVRDNLDHYLNVAKRPDGWKDIKDVVIPLRDELGRGNIAADTNGANQLATMLSSDFVAQLKKKSLAAKEFFTSTTDKAAVAEQEKFMWLQSEYTAHLPSGTDNKEQRDRQRWLRAELYEMLKRILCGPEMCAKKKK